MENNIYDSSTFEALLTKGNNLIQDPENRVFVQTLKLKQITYAVTLLGNIIQDSSKLLQEKHLVETYEKTL